MTADLSIRHKILLAACDLDADGFEVAALTRRAHALYPESFSLGGEGPPAPDHNKVLAKLSGDHGVCGPALRWLEQVAPRTYRVTRRGLVAAAALSPGRASVAARVTAKPRAPRGAPTPTSPARAALPPPPVAPPPPPADADRALVRRLAACDALRKFLRGSPLAFADARRFWLLPEALDAYPEGRLRAAEGALERAVAYLSLDGAPQLDLPPLPTCYGLLNLHRLMASRFAAELRAPAPAAAGEATDA